MFRSRGWWEEDEEAEEAAEEEEEAAEEGCFSFSFLNNGAPMAEASRFSLLVALNVLRDFDPSGLDVVVAPRCRRLWLPREWWVLR